MNKKLFPLFLVTLASTAVHAVEYSSPADVEKVLSRIPVTDKDFSYKHIGQRLPNLGLRVKRVKVERVTKQDAEPPYFLAGDEVIQLFTSEPNDAVKAICPIHGGMAIYVIRRGKVLPQNRTSYWLMTNRCDFKG